MAKTLSTPGVYVAETNAFPNSVVGVATAVPAFIGYTEKAVLNQKDITHVPTRISSLNEYVQHFGGAPKTRFTLQVAAGPNPTFTLTPASQRFLLFRSLQLFFANGGADCYIVSIGNYDNGVRANDFDGTATDPTTGASKPLGLRTLLQEPEPTLVVIPDAVLLTRDECYALQQKMLAHCADTGSRMAILDVYNGGETRSFDNDAIQQFRDGVGNDNLRWGAAYYPWLNTTAVSAADVDFTCIDPGSNSVLAQLLNQEVADALQTGALNAQRAAALQKEIALIGQPQSAPVDPTAVQQLHQTLLAVSPRYQAILTSLREHLNLLPPSAALAGVYTQVDNSVGVFQAPANVSLNLVVSPAAPLTDDEQNLLNDPVSGKAVNAIRAFAGKGVLVWGARTLDGNSQDWRYVNVRRTVIFIEQSAKTALRAYVFAPNTVNTWSAVKVMLESFLTTFWKQGGLVGAHAEDAFSVRIGLGVTMTAQDIADGYLRVTVLAAITRPAEFVVITLEQQMPQS